MTNPKKVCKKCNNIKPLLDFDRSTTTNDGFTNICILCRRLNAKRIYTEKQNGTYKSKKGKPRLSESEKLIRKQEQQIYHKNYRITHANEIRKNKKQYALDAKIEGINIYGGKCACCGETKFEFLTLEHINGRDKTKKRKSGKTAWLELKWLGWPKDGYTVLCFNCNCAKGAYGSCPHTWKDKNK